MIQHLSVEVSSAMESVNGNTNKAEKCIPVFTRITVRVRDDSCAGQLAGSPSVLLVSVILEAGSSSARYIFLNATQGFIKQRRWE